jgi:alpha-beta hydrolase superfamily lysophospholipase
MVESFGAAAELDIPATTKLTIPWRGGFLCGWLLRPPGERPVPAVIIMGGFDGWREEYYLGAIALVERGIAALLVDGPGQGETRLFHGLYLDQNFPDAFSSLADHLRVHCGLGPQIGIWGNSLGGFLAAKSAATYPSQFNALCVNGGTTRPIELPERFPRFFEKVEALVGTKNRAAIIDLMDGIEMREDIAKITCPLLQLHGAPDQVFLLENARLIFDDATSDDKRLLIWEDGDHCLYNHSDEKNALITDWFASQFQAHNYKEFV